MDKQKIDENEARLTNQGLLLTLIQSPTTSKRRRSRRRMNRKSNTLFTVAL